MRPRIIPVLLYKNGGVYKTVKFKDGVYIGDPINTIRLFNEMEVDEIIVLDIGATRNNIGPDFEFIKDFASEAFMPLCYGGGITNIEEIRAIFSIGVEKIALNNRLLKDIEIVQKITKEYGSQSIVGAIDVKNSLLGKPKVYNYITNKTLNMNPVKYACELQNSGIGELFVNSVDNDGVMKGIDVDLIEQLEKKVSIPLIACGGAGNLYDLKQAIDAGASAAAAGSFFVFHGKQKGVLINYPEQSELEDMFGKL